MVRIWIKKMGVIIINPKINFIKGNGTQHNPIQFGGRLYIDKLDEFESSFNTAKINGINVRLFSSTFKTDWCRIFGFQSIISNGISGIACMNIR